MTIKVVVADDQQLLRAGLSGIVDTADDLVVVAQAANGREAVDLARREHADVVLMDIRMPVMDGLEATRELVRTSDVKVLILTTFDLDDYVFTALRHGASGFLLKDTAPEQLLAAIRTVVAGDALLGPGITRRLVREFARRTGDPDGSSPDGSSPDGSSARPAAPGAADITAQVTPRELDVLRLVADGLSNQEIGERLYIGAGTAKTHVGHLLTKLAARDRVQLVILAHRAGLAGPG